MHVNIVSRDKSLLYSRYGCFDKTFNGRHAHASDNSASSEAPQVLRARTPNRARQQQGVPYDEHRPSTPDDTSRGSQYEDKADREHEVACDLGQLRDARVEVLRDLDQTSADDGPERADDTCSVGDREHEHAFAPEWPI